MDIARDEIVRRTSFRKSPTFSKKTPTFLEKSPTFLEKTSEIIPNRSLDRYSADRYGEDNFLASFIFLVGILFLVSSRRSLLRLQTNGKQSVQQSNKICAESNDRFGDYLPDVFPKNVGRFLQKTWEFFLENVGDFRNDVRRTISSLAISMQSLV